MSKPREKFNCLPRYSFILNPSGGVQRVVDTCGNWIEQHQAALIIEVMDDEINHLNSVILALKGDGLKVVKS